MQRVWGHCFLILPYTIYKYESHFILPEAGGCQNLKQRLILLLLPFPISLKG
jgi:hypothetical protein